MTYLAYKPLFMVYYSAQNHPYNIFQAINYHTVRRVALESGKIDNNVMIHLFIDGNAYGTHNSYLKCEIVP
jgi:hypothetical protein